MFTVLQVPSEKLKGKLIEDVKARVSSVSAMLGHRVSYEEALPAFEHGFAQVIGNLGPRSLPGDDELRRAECNAQERFASGAWTFKR
jgi:lipoate-protein ligase A